MTISAELVTALFMGIAAIITAMAALRSANYSRDKIIDLEKENERLSTENEKKSIHNDQQDAVILDQQRKINQWMAWGERIGRKMNQMELAIGASKASQHINANDDTQPLPNKDWITGALGPIDISALKQSDDNDT